jgi:hypothetical protein
MLAGYLLAGFLGLPSLLVPFLSGRRAVTDAAGAARVPFGKATCSRFVFQCLGHGFL